MERISTKNIVSDPACIYFAPRRVVRPNSTSRAVRNSRAMSTSDTTSELAPPSVQVITPLPYDPWRLGRLSRSQAWENAKTALPIHVGHAAGCKVCYYGKDPCPICMYVLPCEDLVPGCFMPIPCCFGVPIPNFFVCAQSTNSLHDVCPGCCEEPRSRDSWAFGDSEKGGDASETCECIVVDKESGMINVYPGKRAGVGPEEMCCTCVPITKLHKLRR